MKRIRTLLALILIVTVGLAACSPATPTPTATMRDTLIVGMGADAVSLDPHRSNDQSSSRVRGHIYETLVAQDNDLNLVPGLATSWTQVDELTFEFKLKQGVLFHDGSAFTASDVKFSLDRGVASPDVGFIMNPIANVEVVDDFTVRLTTKFPFAPMLASLAHPAAAMLSETVVVEGYDFEMPVGTGPFKFVDRVVGDNLTLARFDDYHGTKAVTPNLIFRVIPDNAVRTIELETGAIDIAYDIAPGDVSRVDSNPDLVLVRDANLSMNYIGFNFQKAPFDNVKVRQAINLALDMEAIVEVVLRGVGAPAFGPIGPNVFGSNQDLEPWPFDVAAAKALMAEAGFADGFATTLWTNENQTRMDIAEIVQNQLGEIGITVTVEVLEWGAYLAATAAGEHDMFILGWTTVTADADYGLFPLFHSSQFGGPGNRTYYANTRVDELLEIGRESVDPAARSAAYREAQEIIRDDAPWIFVNTGENISGISSKVSGFRQAPAGIHKLTNVGIAE
jgi:peptide/nickel transport system substrate-binding protein